MSSLFNPIQLGALSLKNRIVMAPLTRCRASEGRIPNELMKLYYTQRAGAGMILTEATAISPMAVGYPNTPGIWSDDQVRGWKQITDSVHQAGGKIICQLWHVGRISHSSYLGGRLPVAPSAVAASGHVSLVRPQVNFETPHALTLSEIQSTINDYRKAAENAKQAGFDGVEIHGANGYLPDQFLESKTNLRSDEYGGTLEKRARFLLEVTDQAIQVWEADRVGVHLSPRGIASDISDANPRETFGFVAQELGKRKIAFLFLRERQEGDFLTPELKKKFGGPIISNDNLDFEKAQGLVQEQIADLVSFGRPFISNPNLVEKLRTGAPLTPADPSTFYGSGPKGYVDYE